MIRHRSVLACVAIVADGRRRPARSGGGHRRRQHRAATPQRADRATPTTSRLPDGTDAGTPAGTTDEPRVRATTDASAISRPRSRSDDHHDHRCSSPVDDARLRRSPRPRRPRAPTDDDNDDNDGRAAERARRSRRAPSSRPSLLAPSRRRRAARSQRRPARPARSASPGTPRDQRRFGDHRLRHPTLRQRGLDLDHHRRRGQHLDHVHRERLDEPHPLPLPGLRPQRHRVEPGRQRHHGDPGQCTHRATLVGGGADQRVASAPPHVDGAAVQRRAGDHRLHHPTITQRLDRVDDDRRRHPRHHGVHRDRTERRHPLLLPDLRQDVDGDGSIEHHRQRHSAHQALGPPFHHRRAEQRLRPGAPDVGGAVVERRRGDHRLPHPTVVERHDVDDHR